MTCLTKDYTTGWFLRRTLKAGAVLIVEKAYTGFLGGATHVDVRNPGTGDYWDRIPIDFFPRK